MERKQAQYDSEIGELKHSIDEQKQKLFELIQRRAEKTCEFHIGDKVANKRGQTGEVISIVDRWDEGIAIIGLYKKDGTMGLRRAETYSWEGWVKVA